MLFSPQLSTKSRSSEESKKRRMSCLCTLGITPFQHTCWGVGKCPNWTSPKYWGYFISNKYLVWWCETNPQKPVRLEWWPIMPQGTSKTVAFPPKEALGVGKTGDFPPKNRWFFPKKRWVSSRNSWCSPKNTCFFSPNKTVFVFFPKKTVGFFNPKKQLPVFSLKNTWFFPNETQVILPKNSLMISGKSSQHAQHRERHLWM